VDYAVWQREWLSGGALEEQLEYWRRQLEGELPVLQMPLDYARPVLNSYRGAHEQRVLPGDFSKSLKRLCLENDVTLFMVLLAAFKTLIHRYTGQEDILIGTPIAGRDHFETVDMVGCFLNTLVLRTDFSGDPTFRELLGRVRELTIESYTHQDLPFEKLLEELQPERALSHTPIFQVFFNMLNTPDTHIELSNVTVKPLSVPEGGSKFDLTLYVKELEMGIQFDLVYNADLFRRERMAEMLGQLSHFLSQVIEDPDKRLVEYSLVTPSAKRLLPNPIEALDDSWGGAVHILFSEQARRAPENTAVADIHETWSYEELDLISNRLANCLRENGIVAGDVVAVYGYRSCPLVWALLGILKAGAAFTILDPAYPPERLINCLRVAKPRGWLQVEAAGTLPTALDQYLAALTIRCRVALPSRASIGRNGVLEGFSTADPLVTVTPDDKAYIAFTSGSTGTPKGIIGRHGPLTHFLPWLKETFHLRETDRFSMLSGISHDPLQRDIFIPLGLGAAVCIPDPDMMTVPGGIARWMAREAISITNLTPAMGQLITEAGQGMQLPRVESLRYAFFVGDVLTRNDVSRLRKLAPGVTVINYYGSTETQRALGYYPVPNGACDGQVSSGRPAKEILPLGRGIKDVQLLVLNASGRLAGVGEIGEIFVRSPHLAQGYLTDERQTTEKFLINPFTGKTGDRIYKTGDLGRYSPDGEVEPLGRADSQVKIRGFRVELGEIEAALEEHPAVCAAVVIAREEEPGRKQIVSYVIAQERRSVRARDLRMHLKERLPEYMAPSAFVMLDQLPLTPNGKIDRGALPALGDNSDRAAEDDYVAPLGPVEEFLAGIWAELLRVEKVGIYDNFFDLGGHSLLLIQVISRVRDIFGLELPLRTIFESPTVAGLAQAIETAGKKSEAPPLTRVERSAYASFPLSYAQQRLWFLDQLNPESGAYNVLFGIRLMGKLNKQALRHSINEIVRRHEALRTSFPVRNGTATQEITTEVRWEIEELDLCGLPKTEREAEAQRMRRAETTQPFDLRRGPLLRVKLLKMAEQEYVLLLTMHHIICDGWSRSIIVREITEYYKAYVTGISPRLPELAIQYADFAIWQREWLKGEVLEQGLEYWRRQLKGVTSLELPTDYPRRTVKNHSAGRVYFRFSTDLTQNLKKLSHSEGVTLFMTLMAGFQALLGWFASRTDIAVGTDIANRNQRETEPLIGFFVNQLVLRTDLGGNPAFTEVLKRVRRASLEAYAHRDLPFEKLVESLAPERALNRSPLVEVKLVMQNEPHEQISILEIGETDKIQIVNEHSAPSQAKFDLLVNLSENANYLQGTMDYRSELFEQSTIEMLASHFEELFTIVTTQPEIRLDSLGEKLETSEERVSREVSAGKLEQIRRKSPQRYSVK
jgi:amino acid adenylation domain-containing protein